MIAMLEQKSSLERGLNKRHSLEEVRPPKPLAIGQNGQRDANHVGQWLLSEISVNEKKCSNLKIM